MSKCQSFLYELNAMRLSPPTCRRALSVPGCPQLAGAGKRTMQQLVVARPAESGVVTHEERVIYARRRRTSKLTGASSANKLVPQRARDASIAQLPDLDPGMSAVAELGRRVEALKATEVPTQPLETSEPFAESELLAIYEDLLVDPSPQPNPATPARSLSPEERSRNIVQALHDRLLPQERDPSPSAAVREASLAHTLRSRRPSTTIAQVTRTEETSVASHNPLLARIEELVVALEAVRHMAPQTSVPLGVLSEQEWGALVDVCIHDKDAQAMDQVFELMKRSGLAIPEEIICRGMSYYANVGDVANTESFMAQFLSQRPTEAQRDIHVKAHLRAAVPQTIPQNALDLLHAYETRGLPAPMKTYTRLINALFAVRPASSPDVPQELAAPAQAQAQAWDLFAHMRYVAHPKPDVHLYAAMIRACALPRSPLTLVGSAEPERALDLWREMTGDARIAPTQEAYEAVVRACARAGEPAYVEEAFRLARAALEGSRNARGDSPFHVSGAMCRALLDGAKRIGALGRVRWILAEMVRRISAASKGPGSARQDGDVLIDEEVMMHVFHAYAAYRVPFKRAMAVFVDGQHVNAAPAADLPQSTANTTESALGSTEYSTQASVVPLHDATRQRAQSSRGLVGQEPLTAPATSGHLNSLPPIDITSEPAFSSLTPQSRAEVLAEVNFLYSQITGAGGYPASTTSPARAAFQDVRLTSRLVNAYLSVHYVHDSLNACHTLWRDAWAEARARGISHNAVAFVDALERCANAKRGAEREVAKAWGDEVWAEWKPFEREWAERRAGGALVGMSSRMVERANAARIRLLAVTHQLDRSLGHLRSFLSLYPPRIVRAPPPTLAMRSTRTQLDAPRPLVRLTSAVLVPDDHVPPLLLWRDLEVLHHRLLTAGDIKGIGLVKYVGSAYEGELRRRREATMKGKGLPVMHPRAVAQM